MPRASSAGHLYVRSRAGRERTRPRRRSLSVERRRQRHEGGPMSLTTRNDRTSTGRGDPLEALGGGFEEVDRSTAIFSRRRGRKRSRKPVGNARP
ncbi:hypothetical protein EA472_19955 [Natrarchaeobius oligotrophus]|uniref:Uncharacterized protein n=1 Tax=Natrarchaeobius chitinivorans TaxID=1679083 RepID=A0A3N6NDF4_NATCH|nr:hypothetical protein EA472_19955 [Natrarchaeobius chitinivorans]